MGGWKTKTGGILAIVAGAAGYGIGFLGYTGLTWDVAFALISGGFVALGLGGKLDKIKAVLEAAKKS